jgi:plastocyanin
MKPNALVAAGLAVAACAGCQTTAPTPEGNLQQVLEPTAFYLPNAEAARIVTVTTNGNANVNVLVQTQRVAVKESGPKETVAKFGEVYAFSPNFFAVHRDEPTRIRFWNLQPDDNHAFMLFDSNSRVLMHAALTPLEETGFVFTFHEEGLFRFACSLHPNAMFGQILVLPPTPSGK